MVHTCVSGDVWHTKVIQLHYPSVGYRETLIYSKYENKGTLSESTGSNADFT